MGNILFGSIDNIPDNLKSFEMLHNPFNNKDLAFTENERKLYNLKGLLPSLILPIEKQTELFMNNIRVMNNVIELLPYIYTPTVGAACLNFGKIYNAQRGLFITLNDENNIEVILKRWPQQNIKAICVTDGERILGLGDLGAHGMGIPIGKLSLYTALGGVDPSLCLPITLDVGTNTKSLLSDEFYLGMKTNRPSTELLEKFVDKFMQSCVKVYGNNVLIQFEDFANHNAFNLLQRYRQSYCMFNDDIQGTAAVVVAGIINAARVLERKISENIILFYGAGEASLGIGILLVMLMQEDGMDEDEARKHIFMMDSKGLIVENRPKGGLTPYKSIFAHKMDPIDTLIEVMGVVRPSMLIGASAQAGSFSPEVLTTMAKLNHQPIIMALSNPTNKAECTAEEAYTHTNGTAIFASGSPFSQVSFNNRLFSPGQANNAYIFPGMGLAIIHARISIIHDKMFLEAAKGLARQVSAKEMKQGRIYPTLDRIRDVSLGVALACCEYAYRFGLAKTAPEPSDKLAFLTANWYNPSYVNVGPSEAKVVAHL